MLVAAATSAGAIPYPQDDEPATLLEQLLDAVGVVGIVDVLEVGLVEHDEHVLGQRVEEGDELTAAVARAGGVVRVADVDELRARADRGRQRGEVVPQVAQRHLLRHGAELHGVEHVARERRPAADDLVARLERRLREQVDHPVRTGTDDDLLEPDPVTLGERSPQLVDAAVGVTVQAACSAFDRLDRSRERRIGAFVGSELDDARETELALHLLDRLAGLVRDERRQRRPQEAVFRHSAALPFDFLRQNMTAPPVAAAIVAIADLLRPAWSPVPGTAQFAFSLTTHLPIFQTPQPRTAFRLFTMLTAPSFLWGRAYRTSEARPGA